MKTISLFSGCGGMDMGAEKAGAEVLIANDIMPETQKTFEIHFPHVDFIPGDIKEFTKFPSAEMVTGGYPCQSFSMGGNRNPINDKRTHLFKEFARCVDVVNPKFFIAENVSGMKSLNKGHWLTEQLDLFSTLGSHGYNTTFKIIHADRYGIPQRRKRLFIVGVRKNLGAFYRFPKETHGSDSDVKKLGLKPYVSHGDIISGLPLWPTGEFYERPHDPKGHWAWYYMSRNRKAKWDRPAYTVVANFRHVTLHPASPVMKMVWSDLANGWKQKWEFTDEYEHIAGYPERSILEQPRRLSWRECALIQSFPNDFEPYGKLEKIFQQIGNAVPPQLFTQIVDPIVTGKGLFASPNEDEDGANYVAKSAS